MSIRTLSKRIGNQLRHQTKSRLRSSFQILMAMLFVGALCIAGTRKARAGGGPENVFLVVNATSEDSITIANHYIHLRKIPPSHVFFVRWAGSRGTAPSADFRTQVLVPAIQEMSTREIAGQIDYLIYSSDFPYAIDFSAEFKKPIGDGKKKLLVPARNGAPATLLNPPISSINNATYFWQWTVNHNTNFFRIASNAYFCDPNLTGRRKETRGFRGWYGWNQSGNRDDKGQHYLISTMLGVTTGARHNTLAEVLSYLRRSAAADGTRPTDGTFYFVKNYSRAGAAAKLDVRTTTRVHHRGGVDLFRQTSEQLKAMGLLSRVVPASPPVSVPRNLRKVQGIMMGIAKFRWSDSGSAIMPGAICDHLTSFGGRLEKKSSHTPLTDYLKHGAAGACGAIVEPYAFWHKFPIAWIHVHYARGCSLGEAFYQSVYAPFHLLIVGDPLCQPWAKIPKVTAKGLVDGAEVSGMLEIKPAAKSPDDKTAMSRFELFVDGRRLASCKPTGTLSIDTTTLSEGYHELRVVAIDNSPIETQGRMFASVVVNNSEKNKFSLRTTARTKARWGQAMYLTVSHPTKKDKESIVALYANGRRFEPKAIKLKNGVRYKIDPRIFGEGPVTFQAIEYEVKEGRRHDLAATEPITLQISAPKSSR